MKRFKLATLVLSGAIGLSACDTESPLAAGAAPDEAPSLQLSTSTDFASHTVVLGYAETITDPLSGEAGRVTWFRQDLGNGQLAHDFAYGDPRRMGFNGGKPGVTYGVNTGFPSADANLTDQVGWLYKSIRSWDAQTCSNMGLTENAVPAGHVGVVDNYFRTGRLVANWKADMTQVGFLGEGAMFPKGTSTLGVTYTLFWVDGNGNYTDIDGNGKIDIAFREIYYNDQYEWADNGLEGRQADGKRYFDFPAVAIHEVGHGFSAAHFGSIGIKDGYLFAKPKAIMNAIYGGIQRELTGRDVGSHCSNWAQWPTN